MRLLSSPLFRSYVLNCAMGRALLALQVEGPDASANFERLLSEPLTPSQVRDWLHHDSREQRPGRRLGRGEEPVANPTLRDYQPRLAGICFELLSKIGDVHVQGACAIAFGGSPNPAEELVPRHNLP